MKYSLACALICTLVLLTGCSQSPEKLLAAANKYHQNKKYQEASILYRKVLLKDKTNAEAYYREGLNLLDQAKVSEAASYLRRAVDLREDVRQGSGRVDRDLGLRRRRRPPGECGEHHAERENGRDEKRVAGVEAHLAPSFVSAAGSRSSI